MCTQSLDGITTSSNHEYYSPQIILHKLLVDVQMYGYHELEYLYKWASVQFGRSKDQVGSQAGVPERQMAGPNPQKGPTNIPELL